MTHPHEIETLLSRASELAVAATNDCHDYHQASELSRVVDLIDSALARVRYEATVERVQ